MQVLVHVLVLERILGCLLRGSRTSIQVLELGAEAHAYFERIGHLVVNMGYSRYDVLLENRLMFSDHCN
jgi:hypothetical protein